MDICCWTSEKWSYRMVWCCFCRRTSNRNGTWTSRTRLHFSYFPRRLYAHVHLLTSSSYIGCCIIIRLDTPPYLFAEPGGADGIYAPLKKIKQLQHPVVDTHNPHCVSALLSLVIINRGIRSNLSFYLSKCQKQLRIQIQGLTRKTYPNDTARSRICW